MLINVKVVLKESFVSVSRAVDESYLQRDRY
jgi:hypothetical protein